MKGKKSASSDCMAKEFQLKIRKKCSSFFALEDYLFLCADLWELKYACRVCQLNGYQTLPQERRSVSCHADPVIITVAAQELSGACCVPVYYLIEL